MYALFEYKGKQYKAEKDALVQVDFNGEKDGAKIDIDTVLLVSDGDKVSVGTPYVKGAKVSVEVEASWYDDQDGNSVPTHGKKVLVFKYKSKKDYHRLIGHRQKYTQIRIKDIVVA